MTTPNLQRPLANSALARRLAQVQKLAKKKPANTDQQDISVPDYNVVLDKETEKRVVAWVNERYATMKNDRSRIELQWAINLAFYYGKQYVEPYRAGIINGGVPTNSGRLFVPPVPPWRTRLVINRIRGIVRTEVSKLTSQKPSVTVTPASIEDRDLFAANAAEQIWEYLYRDKNVKAKIRRAVWWASVTGCGYIKTYWKKDAYDPVNEVDGDICFENPTPFHIMVPDLRCEDIEDQPYIMEVQARSPEYVASMYPQITNLNADTNAANDILSDSFIDLMAGQGSQKNNSIMVKQVWIKPKQMPNIMPNGGTITIVGDKVVQFYNKWPYEHYCYPISKLDHIPTGKYYAASSIEDIIPLQKELNRSRSQIVESKNKMSKPQLIAAKGSVDPSKITTEPGLVITYIPGFDPPQPLPLSSLPAYVTQEIDRILQDINDISGQHEVSKGQTPPGVTAATAISYLQEQDESMLSHTYDSLEEAIEKVAISSLSLVHQYWAQKRQIKITSTEGLFDVSAFQGSDLNTGSDIKVESGSSLPTSKSARIAFIMDMMKMGFIRPEEGLEVLDMGGLNKLTDKIKLDKRQAQRENLKMAALVQEDVNQYNQLEMQKAAPIPNPVDPTQAIPTNPNYIDQNTGQPINPPIIVPTNTWDNHLVHIEVHNDYRKTQAFEALSDINKQVFEAHVQDHMNAYMAEKMNFTPKPTGQDNSGTVQYDQQGSSQQENPNSESQGSYGQQDLTGMQ